MKSQFKLLVAFLIIIAVYYKAESQDTGCSSKTFTGSYFFIDYPSTFPEYDLNMPYEVLLGYVALDTVGYYGNIYEYDDFMSGQEYNDTLKTLMKHYYHVVDWNGVKFLQSKFYKDTAMHISVDNVRNRLDDLIKEKSDKPYLDYILCHTDIIAHVLVKDTVSWVNNSAVSVGKYGATVECELIEPIKGKIIPDIIEPQPLNMKHKLPETQGLTSADSGKTLVFDYCFGWPRKSGDGRFLNMRDSTGAPWVKKSQEYIVFLDLLVKCIDNDTICYYLRPNGPSKSSTGLLYPIVDGIVYLPLDDFGFGTGLTVSEFKVALKNRINQIKNFTVE